MISFEVSFDQNLRLVDQFGCGSIYKHLLQRSFETDHYLHGGPSRRPPIQGPALVDDVGECSHRLCNRTTATDLSNN